MIDFNHLDNLLDSGQELNDEEIQWTCALLLSSTVSDEYKAEILIKLHLRGETAAEIAGFAREFKALAVDPAISLDDCGGTLMDVCGTGADKLNTFNISTAVMFVVAAAGVCVAKHGNRSITSQCGGADVLEGLGIKIDHSPDKLRGLIMTHGLAFFFAPLFHPAFKQIAPVRKMLAAKGYHSIFNFLGPLLNPAPINYQLVGLSNHGLLEKYAQTLRLLGRERAWVAHGFIDENKSQGMDEISIFGPTQIADICLETVDFSEVDFREHFTVDRTWTIDSLKGGDAKLNASIVVDILKGQEMNSPRTKIVLANAAAALLIAKKVKTYKDGIVTAKEMIFSGKAFAKLQALRAA